MAPPTRYMGKNSRVYAAGYAIHRWLRNLKISISGDNPVESTIGQDDHTRTEDGMIDGGISYSGVADDSSGAINSLLEANLGAEYVVWSIMPGGDNAIGDVCWAMQGIDNDYSSEGENTDLCAFDGGSEGDDGPVKCAVLHPLAARTTSSQAASLDNGAATTNGGSAFIHCTATTAPTSLAVIIQASTTNAFAGEETTLATFTTITAANRAERIEFSGTVPRYLRAKWTIAGTSFTFHVAVHRD